MTLLKPNLDAQWETTHASGEVAERRVTVVSVKKEATVDMISSDRMQAKDWEQASIGWFLY